MLAVTYTVRPVLPARTLAPVQVPWAIVCGSAPFAAVARLAPLIWGAICVLGLPTAAGVVTRNATATQDDRRGRRRDIAACSADSEADKEPKNMAPEGQPDCKTGRGRKE